jgi:hypothetical protein
MDIRGYFRQARRLPLNVTLKKAAALVGRTGRSRMRLATEIVHGSYGAGTSKLNPAARISIAADDVPAGLQATLRILSEYYLDHRFDLLGSGWVSPVYRFEAPGFLGHRYPPCGPRAPERDGSGLEIVVNRSNFERARQIWRLIGRADYTPIDWQLDFRSGYRWSAQRPSLHLDIPVDAGADVKVPWELSRLQHLPQLALCAILAKADVPGFAAHARYVQEISDQLADFLATNPPRFGVNWIGAMDVSIRAANIALTLALLAGANIVLSTEMNAVAAGALEDHATHVVEHLEYSESGRSNHYLANLGGLVWANWLLSGDKSDGMLVFAVAEILKEADVQFLADGGNYEGSTNYHRLSGEIVLFSLAIVASLGETALARLEHAKAPNRPWRAAFPVLPLRRHAIATSGLALISPLVLRKLKAAGHLSRAAQGNDGTIVQIGDTDSGRFFKLHPTILPGDDKLSENTLDHSGFADAVESFFGRKNASVDSILVRRLCAMASAAEPPAAPTLADFGDLDALMTRWESTPEPSRRVRRVSLGATSADGNWLRTAFPDFGLYIFRHQNRLVAFRCAGAPPKLAPGGHRHDDNLAIEYRLDSLVRRDPGSYVYTPSVSQRNRYRSAAAHDVPRRRGQTFAMMSARLFDLNDMAPAQCLCWRPDAVAGEIRDQSGTILRIIRITSEALEIFDCVDPGEISDIADPLPIARGYGKL